MQPSRPGRHRLASTITALHSTNAPCTVAAFGWSVTSTANSCTPTPTCGGGEADAARATRAWSRQVGGQRHHLRVGRVDGLADPAQHRRRRGDDRQHPAGRAP